ncbi:MAG: hypothetical protein ACP5UP_07220 [Athalassotoga sp.]|uniref:hypothetical protein n=1 Tax=Athalassotoga sp. TaxID=2022597 RepID=UPI003D086B08
MKRTFSTHLEHSFDQLNYVKFVMQRILDGLKIDEIKKEFIYKNPFGIKSENSRRTYINWIIRDYINGFKAKELMVFAKIIADDRINPQIKREILFWKNCLSDELMRSITTDFIFERYQKVKLFKKQELEDFISERVSLKPVTIHKCAIDYIALTEKIGFFSSNNEICQFNFYRPYIESVIFLVFYLLNSQKTPLQIIKAEDFKYLLISENELIKALKEIQSKGLISFAISGDVIRMDPKIEFEAVADAIKY